MSVLNLESLQRQVVASLPTKDVDALGGQVRIRKLAALAFAKVSAEHQAMDAAAKAAGVDEPGVAQNVEFLILLVSLSVVDDAGNLMLANAEGRQLLGGIDTDQLLAVGNACLDLNGFTDADESEEATVDRKKKRSKRPRSGASPSSSATS